MKVQNGKPGLVDDTKEFLKSPTRIYDPSKHTDHAEGSIDIFAVFEVRFT